MADNDGRMTREEMDDAEEVVDLAAKIALVGAAALAAPAVSMVWGRARGFWMGQINVLLMESLLLNLAYVALLGVTALSAVVAAEAFWHGRPARARPAILLHIVSLVATLLVGGSVLVSTYRWIFDVNTMPIAFVVYLSILLATLGLAGLVYNLHRGKRTADQIHRAIRASMQPVMTNQP
jgi:hypothetical protein